jgi:hypothetical protein
MTRQERIDKIEAAFREFEDGIGDIDAARRALAEAIVDDSEAAIASLGGDLESTYGSRVTDTAAMQREPGSTILATLGAIIQRRRQDQEKPG